ncbi:MAG: MBOAT family O-acyltransferase [Lachnospiraceae bacterium]|nr:MBOAT family O-acyltransferase [Lachnospiraceae bacterium]
MSYTSLIFWAFVCACILLYFLFPKAHRWWVLLAASWFFYGYSSLKYCYYILFTTVTTWGFALLLDRMAEQTKSEVKSHSEWGRPEKKAYKEKRKKLSGRMLLLYVILNIGILVFLKYYTAAMGGINSLLGEAHALPVMKLILPLGISFYTFQSVGYVIDVRNGLVRAEKNFAKVSLFVSFFPQIIQGPISFYDQLAGQLYEGHDFDWNRFVSGAELILWGLFKKMLIADRAVNAVHSISDRYSEFNGTSLTFALLMYALQLYVDFSAGIDISRGIAEIIGINMTENFHQPYFSTSINDYWRRWHISLGGWMKKYIFYPVAVLPVLTRASKSIGKSGFGKTRYGSNIAKTLAAAVGSLIVFIVVGIWHGSEARYFFFGLYNGLIIMISVLFKPFFEDINRWLHIPSESKGMYLFRMIRTFILVLIGYVFDIAPNMAGVRAFFVRMLTDQNVHIFMQQKRASVNLSMLDLQVILFGTLVVLVSSVIQETRKVTIREMLKTRPVIRWIILTSAIALIVIFGVYGPNFDSVQFVYAQY